MKTWDEAAFIWSHAPDWGKTGHTQVADARGEVVGTLQWAKDRRVLRVDATGSRWEFETCWLREQTRTSRRGFARMFAPAPYQSVVLVRSVGTGAEVARYTLDPSRVGGTLVLRSGTTYVWQPEVPGESWAWHDGDGMPVMALHQTNALPERAAVLVEKEGEDTSILLFLACYLILLYEDAAVASSMTAMTTALSV